MRPAHSSSGRASALIGPNAVLQLHNAIEHQLGADSASIILATAGISALPSGLEMIPERDALRLHQALVAMAPHHAMHIVRQAGVGTADYIIANRIPAPAKWLLRSLPARLAGPLLMVAIREHAWTFVGAGSFTVQDAWSFCIDRAGLKEEAPPPTAYTWYGAVFSRLYQVLVSEVCECCDCQEGMRRSSRHDYRIAPFAA